jgi:hypothetical protein
VYEASLSGCIQGLIPLGRHDRQGAGEEEKFLIQQNR